MSYEEENDGYSTEAMALPQHVRDALSTALGVLGGIRCKLMGDERGFQTDEEYVELIESVQQDIADILFDQIDEAEPDEQ